MTDAPVPPDRSFALSDACAWFLLILSLAFGCADVITGRWDHDGGFYLLHGAYAAEGLRPYIDYTYIYPPLINLLTAAFVLLPIDRFVLALAIPMGWIIANTAATGLLTQVVTRHKTLSVLVAALYPLFSIQNGGNHLTLEHGVSLFGALTFAILLRGERFTVRDAALAGLAWSAACLSKQNGVIVLLPVAAIVWMKRDEVTRRHWIAFASGVAVLPLLMLVWLGFNVPAVYRSLFQKLAVYAASSGSQPRFLWDTEWGRAPEFVMICAVAVAAAIAAAVAAPRTRLLVITTLAGAALQFAPRLMRDYPHYDLNMWPFLALAIGLGLAQIPASRRRSGVLVATIAAFFFTMGAASRYPQRLPQLVTLWNAALVVHTVTPPDAVVRQYGSEPVIEFFAERREELIERPDSIMAWWDGGGVYAQEPPPGTTVVIVNQGQPWIRDVVQQLGRWGFRIVDQIGNVAVLRRPQNQR